MPRFLFFTYILSMDDLTPKGAKIDFRGQKHLPFFTYKAQIHTLHK